MNLALTSIRTYFKVISFLSPKMAGKKAIETFQKVRKKTIRERELTFFEKANHFKVETAIEEIDCYQMGEKDKPLVILVHGWDSNAGSLAHIANELVNGGFQICAFNLPGHAFYKKDKTNIIECAAVFTAVVNHLELTAPVSVLSHSFGSAVVSYALSKNNPPIDQLIFLTMPNKIEDIFKEFKEMIGLGDKAYKEMIAFSEVKLKTDLQKVSVVESLKKIKFKGLSLLHDKGDKILPYANALTIRKEIPAAKVYTFERTGHYKMLWNSEVSQCCLTILKNK